MDTDKQTGFQTVVDGEVTSNSSDKLNLFSRYLRPFAFVICFIILGGGAVWFANAATTSYSLWSNHVVPKIITSYDTHGIELGLKFQSKVAGQVTGVRFYKGAQNTGTHTGSLWQSNGTLLANVTFRYTSRSGWQTATFAHPVSIAANVTYVVSYFAPHGRYSVNYNYFKWSYKNNNLVALGTSVDGGNGVYAYTNGSPTFPYQSGYGANYWVDLEFTSKLIAPVAAPAAPSSITATQESSSVVVSWSASQSANPVKQYNVFRNGAQLASVTTTSYTDNIIAPGQTYKYSVEAVDTTGAISAMSATASVTIPSTSKSPAPTCPSNETGTPPNCTAPPTPPTPTPPTPTPPTPVTTSSGLLLGLFTSNENESTAESLAASWGVTAQVLDVYADQPDYTSLPGVPSGSMRLSVGVGAVTPAQATTIGKMLVASGDANAFIRIMWEMNGNWFPWGVDGGSLGFSDSQYISTFQAAATAFRAVAGNHFVIVWNTNGNSTVPTGAYPGSSYVDQIGIDQYDYSGYASQIQDIISFAKTQGKPVQIDEWGVNGQNDASYINTVSSDVHNAANNFSLQVYFNDGNSTLNNYPAALAAYKSDF